MIRHLHPTDPPAFLPFKQAAGRARAYTLAMAIRGDGGPFSAVRYTGLTLSPRAWRSCWIQTRRSQIQVALRAGQRSGRLAWEVRDLYVHRKFQESVCDALEQLSAPAARAGARRLFIRIMAADPLYEQVRKAGFSALENETLYRAESASAASRLLGRPSAPMQLRPRASADDWGLFRLYCATAPLNLRMRVSQTAAEWRDSLEKPGRGVREWVMDGASGGIGGWLRTAGGRGGSYFDAAWLSERPDALHRLLSAGLEMGDGPVSTLVPERNSGMASLLQEIGFCEGLTYTVMVKALAVRAREGRSVAAAVG